MQLGFRKPVTTELPFTTPSWIMLKKVRSWLSITDSIYGLSCPGTINTVKSVPEWNKKILPQSSAGDFPFVHTCYFTTDQAALSPPVVVFALCTALGPAPENLFLSSTANNFGPIRLAKRSLHTGNKFFYITCLFSREKNPKYVLAAEVLMQRVFYQNRPQTKIWAHQANKLAMFTQQLYHKGSPP